MKTGKMPIEHAIKVCKLGCGEDSCCYLGCGPDGWICLKVTSMCSLIDEKRRNAGIVAKGDHCEGFEIELDSKEKTWN